MKRETEQKVAIDKIGQRENAFSILAEIIAQYHCQKAKATKSPDTTCLSKEEQNGK